MADEDVAAESEGPEDGRQEAGEQPGRPWWRRPWRVASLGVAVAALAVGGIVWLTSTGSSDEDPEAGATPTGTDDAPVDDDETPTPDSTPEETPSAPDNTPAPGEEPDEPDDSDEPSDGDDGGTETSPTSKPTDSPMDPDEALRQAERVLGEFIAESDAAYQDPQAELNSLAAIANGVALSEVQASVTELENIEWRQTGEADVVEFIPGDVDVSAAPETVEIAACLDTSGIDIVDQSGESVRESADEDAARTLHEYRVEYVDGAWLVVDHAFPDDADC